MTEDNCALRIVNCEMEHCRKREAESKEFGLQGLRRASRRRRVL